MIAVRPAVYDDGPVLARIDLVTWSPGASPAPAPSDVTSHVFFDDRTSPGDVLVAEVDARVVGWVKVQPPTPLPSNQHVLHINGLAVDPDNQGAGIGRRLVRAAVQECRRRGARKITLRVLGPNTAARHVYDTCGFVTEGVLRHEFWLNNTYVDDVLMARDLTQPGS